MNQTNGGMILRMSLLRLFALPLLLTAVGPGAAEAKMSVLSSPHNLSASGGKGRSTGLPGVSFSAEQRVCVFCHVPHKATGAPLWSRALSPEETEYKPYQSSTINASPKPDKPTGGSRLCLSCHDGTIALSQYSGSPLTEEVRMPAGSTANLTTDLSDDHPISFSYTETLAEKSHLVSPAALSGAISLQDGVVLQCTACHDPHNNQYGNFLVMNNSNPGKADYQPGSPLCVACHRPAGWEASSHNPKQTASLVNGCLNCHAVHNAPGPERLLRHAKEEDNCLASCHNGAIAGSLNLKPLFAETMHRHPVDDPDGRGIHDANETLPAQGYHVQCVDCHNPHQSNPANAPLAAAPLINGRLKGVRKDALGGEATMEYEVCFKCHAGENAGKFSGVNETDPNRVIADPDQFDRFDPRNPSFHPVLAERRSNGASLLLELQANMRRIYCVDCHNSDQGTRAGGSGPNGPHGSKYQHILIAQYDQPVSGEPRNQYNKSQYALCFRCHAEEYVMTTGSAFSDPGTNHHDSHVRQRLIPCFACHDPHGTPWKLLATPEKNAHLINFDINYASGTLVENPRYSTTAAGTGSCTVNCHTVSGNTQSYSTNPAKSLLFRRSSLPGTR